MASDVEICNLALSHLGDTANVTSIDPPEGSAQAEHCSRFYPVARGMLIEAHDWSWATRRISLTPLVATVSPWAYAYGKPNLMIKAIAVLDPEASDDYTIPAAFETERAYLPLSYAPLAYAPQPFAIETLPTGEEAILTNQENAVLRCIVSVTDTAKFPPLAVMALSWLVASMLAGPIIKGEKGAAEAKRCLAVYKEVLGMAVNSDSNQRSTPVTHIVPWINRR